LEENLMKKMNKKLLSLAITGALMLFAHVNADDGKHKGHFNFKPIDESADKADWDPAAP
jgi:hypothetical protein